MKKSLLFILPILCLSLSGCGSKGYQFENVSNENGSMSYEIFVRSFYDSNGDGIGDLNGVKKPLLDITNIKDYITRVVLTPRCLISI